MKMSARRSNFIHNFVGLYYKRFTHSYIKLNVYRTPKRNRNRPKIRCLTENLNTINYDRTRHSLSTSTEAKNLFSRFHHKNLRETLL